VWQVAVSSGTATSLGEIPDGWRPICPIGTGSLVGLLSEPDARATVVGPAEIGDFELPTGDSALGCSADGKYFYTQRVPQPLGEDNDTEPANPATTLNRIELRDGTVEAALTLAPGDLVQAITR
jgi:hypothetical protein